MAQDLNDQELDELDNLLADTPAPLEPLDIVMLDGYLCGVLAQPRLIERTEWLPPVFDLEGRSLPDTVDAAWLARCTALLEKRHAALNRGMAEDGWFDPVLHESMPEPDPEAGSDAADVWAGMPEISRPLFSWVAGFQYATTVFPELTSLDEDEVVSALDRVFRHLPPETDEDREIVQALNDAVPLATVDEAVEDLVLAVADLWELTSEARFRVEPVRRDTPKVGRNDPCPCGSGKKYKQCHGA
ncbi:UPF0149 family protein [Ideonella sp. BN130291]|uniref:UPF0149 family protein n=1 Tax=Ideonella sp. BN130291 TaxID=3112940 RepID=UPI002E275249|nr:UPF0149 family protein [Ideonella sp. BN130291]